MANPATAATLSGPRLPGALPPEGASHIATCFFCRYIAAGSPKMTPLAVLGGHTVEGWKEYIWRVGDVMPLPLGAP